MDQGKRPREGESQPFVKTAAAALTAAVCVTISARRQRKTAILRDDREEDVEGKDDPFHPIKASNGI